MNIGTLESVLKELITVHMLGLQEVSCSVCLSHTMYNGDVCTHPVCTLAEAPLKSGHLDRWNTSLIGP